QIVAQPRPDEPTQYKLENVRSCRPSSFAKVFSDEPYVGSIPWRCLWSSTLMAVIVSRVVTTAAVFVGQSHESGRHYLICRLRWAAGRDGIVTLPRPSRLPRFSGHPLRTEL